MTVQASGRITVSFTPASKVPHLVFLAMVSPSEAVDYVEPGPALFVQISVALLFLHDPDIAWGGFNHTITSTGGRAAASSVFPPENSDDCGIANEKGRTHAETKCPHILNRQLGSTPNSHCRRKSMREGVTVKKSYIIQDRIDTKTSRQVACRCSICKQAFDRAPSGARSICLRLWLERLLSPSLLVASPIQTNESHLLWVWEPMTRRTLRLSF